MTGRSLRTVVRRAARARPDATAAELAAVCGCSPATVRRHLAAIRHHTTTTPPQPTRSLSGFLKVVHPNKRTPREVLVRLLHDTDPVLQDQALEHLGTPEPVLRHVAAAGPARCHTAVARHSNTSPATLGRLARSADSTARIVVAKDRRTPATALGRLAADSEPSVRIRVASNPNSPARLLAVLAADPDEDVAAQAAAHHRCPPLAARRRL